MRLVSLQFGVHLRLLCQTRGELTGLPEVDLVMRAGQSSNTIMS